MSLWGAIGSAVGGYFGGSTGAQVGNAIGGSIDSQNANNSATQAITQGNNDALDYVKQHDAQARQDLLDAKGQGIGFLDSAGSAINGYLAPYAAQGKPAQNYWGQQLTTDYTKLTPMQQIGLEDLTRQTTNNLSTSGMRGSGRAGQAVLADAQRRYMAGAYATNQGRADQAASVLGGQGFAATQGMGNAALGIASGKANTALGTGSGIANIGLGEGQTGAQTIRSNADATANDTIANSQLTGSALGSALAKIGAPSATQTQDRFAYAGTGGGQAAPWVNPDTVNNGPDGPTYNGYGYVPANLPIA